MSHPLSSRLLVCVLSYIGLQVSGVQAAKQQDLPMLLQDNLQVPNTMEQRLAACSQCHGEYGYGNTTDPNIPRLAEKPAGYLYKQLLSFKNGEGRNQAMEYVVRQLSPAYMQEIAQYYAAQRIRSEEHTSELQSRPHLVCRLLL